MSILKLKPATKDFIWGGNKFLSWGKENPSGVIAEAWELSFNENGPSMIVSGPDAGKYLKDVITPAQLGKKCDKFKFFPMLIKLIDAKNNLSVQVHPSDDYALRYENQFGKTEMWYVIENDPGCGLYIGFNKDVTKKEFVERINNNSLMEIMNFVEVKPGDCFFIPSGTVHAIGKGVTIIEIQQNSNLTYRIYDYGRIGKDGKPRELHIDKAIKVTNLNKYQSMEFKRPLLGQSEYFTVYECYVDGEANIVAPNDSFCSFTFIDGVGYVDEIEYKKGDTFFLPAGEGSKITGKGKYILSMVK